MTERERREIEMCLNCPLPECVDCLGSTVRATSAKKAQRMQEIKRMAALGYTDRQMGAVLGIAANTVLLLRKELGIANLRTRRVAAKGGVA